MAWAPALTDEELAVVLVSTETGRVLAKRYGCSEWVISRHRRRESKQALRLARRMGLPPLSPWRGGYTPEGLVIHRLAEVFQRNLVD